MSKHNPPLVITGATGFLGKSLTRELIERDHEVWIITRDPQKAEEIFKNWPVNIINASLTNVESLKEIPSFSRIFHCGAITGSIQASKKDYDHINILGTQNLLNAAIANHATSFTFVSSISAVGAVGSLGNPITEITTPNPKTYYGQSKLEAERVILNLAPASMPITIVRPPLIYGEEQRPTSGAATLFRVCKKSIVPILGNPESLFPLVYIKNVVSGMIDLTLNNTGKEIFNVADIDFYTLKKLTFTMNNSTHKKYIPIPQAILCIPGLLSEGISSLFQKDFGLSFEAIKGISNNGFILNIDKALRFGYSPQSTFDVIKNF